jgi:hypothetical protein
MDKSFLASFWSRATLHRLILLFYKARMNKRKYKMSFFISLNRPIMLTRFSLSCHIAITIIMMPRWYAHKPHNNSKTFLEIM